MISVPSAPRASGRMPIAPLDLMPERHGLASSMIESARVGYSAVVAGVIPYQVYGRALTRELCSLVIDPLVFASRLVFLARLALHLHGARA